MMPLFSNLINNSLKYSKKQEAPLIRVRADISPAADDNGAKETDARYCRIYVEDNGIGFDQKYAGQIFDMFRRLHPNAQYEGTGIGLALCKRIVEKHRGFITARSRPGEGAIFIVSLPVLPVTTGIEVNND
jgi:signal transduction histidine kinase